MTSIINEVVPKMRRAIDDNKPPYVYTDEALAEYIEDGIESLEIDWEHGYVVDREAHTIEPNVVPKHQAVFVLKAKYDMFLRQPDISFNTGDLSVTAKADVKKIVSDRLENVIEQLKILDGVLVLSDVEIADWI